MKAIDYVATEDILETTLTEEVSDAIIGSFHQLLYSSTVHMRTFWRGRPVMKLPSDLFIYQELIHLTQPDYLIETGTMYGGSALFFADMMELMGHGEVITIDSNFRPDRPAHPRIKYISGDSVGVATEVAAIVQGKTVLVSLDSDHEKQHVLAEMKVYAPLATEFLVVEDTNINHPIQIDPPYEGPMEAVMEFLETHNEFEIYTDAHKFLLTQHPNGWLRRRCDGKETSQRQAD